MIFLMMRAAHKLLILVASRGEGTRVGFVGRGGRESLGFQKTLQSFTELVTVYSI